MSNIDDRDEKLAGTNDQVDELSEDDVQHTYSEIHKAFEALKDTYETDEASKENLEPTKSVGSPLENDDDNFSNADQPLDVQTLLEKTTYVGTTPYSTIVESITSQFEDYISLQDDGDYVDIFYDQLQDSFEEVEDQDEYQDERREILYGLEDSFISFMSDEFNTRLGISITSLDSEETDYDSVEDVIRKLYEYFILDARKNFEYVLAQDIVPNITASPENDPEYLKEIQRRVMSYSPIITTVTPERFLELSGGSEIRRLYEENLIVGNFLRKYSMKLYQHPDYEVELINYISLYDTTDDLSKEE